MLMKTKKATMLVKGPASIGAAVVQALKTGKCRGGDGNKIATHSQSGLCDNCLGNLSVKRRQQVSEPSKRVAYRARLELAHWREEELLRAPKGYKKGAAR